MKKYSLIKSKKLVNIYGDEFSPLIKQRGREYYEQGHVINCIKTANSIYSFVEGNELYQVRMVKNGNDYLRMSCTCPCDYPCKHEYATLLMIDNKKYIEVELLEEIKEIGISLKDLITNIPEKELKEYLLSSKFTYHEYLDKPELYAKFIKYLPVQEYNYYYNNLYNAFLLESVTGYNQLTTALKNKYFDSIKSYLEGSCPLEAFTIIKAILEAGFETNTVITELIPHLSMYFRICFRQANPEEKAEIIKYLDQLKASNYHDSLYIEDMVLLIK
ncbi:MAG: hypothetical protein RSA48_03290 [Bacilli bacterium]